MPDAAYLQFRLSGGAGNTDPDLSLGGIMSSEQVLSQSSSNNSPLAGVSYLDGFGNPQNVGDVELEAGPILRWVPTGDAFLNEADVSANGTYSLHAIGGGVIIVDVVTASLGTPPLSQTITISNQTNELFDDIPSDESWNGSTDYRCIFITNTHGTLTFNTVKVWIEQQPLGADVLRLGYNSAKKNNDAETVGSETTAPSGSVVFGTHEDEAGAIDLSALAAGDRWPIWVERTIAAETIIGSKTNVFRLTVLGLE